MSQVAMDLLELGEAVCLSLLFENTSSRKGSQVWITYQTERAGSPTKGTP